MPANLILRWPKTRRTIIEWITSASLFTEKTSDFFLQGRANESLLNWLNKSKKSNRDKRRASIRLTRKLKVP
jgi:hypothetical protein